MRMEPSMQPDHKKLWWLFGGTLADRLHPARASSAARSTARRRRSPSASSPPSGDVAHDRETTSSTASRSGSPPAASSSARSGATAPTRRPTGRPTGCTARRSRCSDVWAERRGRGTPFAALAARPRRPRCATRLRARCAPTPTTPATGTVTRRPTTAPRRCAAPPRTTTRSSAATRRCAKLREDYAMQEVAVPDAGAPSALTDFFFWTSWACVDRAARRGRHLHQQLAARAAGRQPADRRQRPVVDRQRRAAARRRRRARLVAAPSAAQRRAARSRRPRSDPFGADRAHAVDARRRQVRRPWSSRCSSCRSLLGALTAHYTVEGPVVLRLPARRSTCRTPDAHLAHPDRRCSGSRPRSWPPACSWRRSSAAASRASSASASTCCSARCCSSSSARWPASASSIHQRLGLDAGFWFGHQGYEYVDLGRAWQIALFVGLVLWLVLMLRGLWPALSAQDGSRSLVLHVHRRQRRDRPACTAPASSSARART